MAGRDEHRMVFDIRGRRGVALKVVYAILALLMVASLFLVTGALNVGTLFGNGSSGESAASNLQDQARSLEAKLRREPESEDLLAGLTRTRINVATALINEGKGESQDGVEEIKQEWAQASEDWSKYTAAAAEPSVGIAIQSALMLRELAGLSSSNGEAREVLKSAAEAQEIVAEGRPSLNSFSTLSFYSLLAGNFKAAETAKEEAIAKTHGKLERESFENQYKAEEELAKEFEKSLKSEAAAKKAEAAGGGGGKGALEKPSLGGLGGTTLGGG